VPIIVSVNEEYVKRTHVTYSIFTVGRGHLLNANKENQRADLSEEEFFALDDSELFGIEQKEVGIAGGRRKGVKSIDDVVEMGFKASRFMKFKVASKFGFGTYNELRKLTAGKGYEVQHLFEQRFAGLFNQKVGDMTSVVLTREEHRKFTNEWRGLIGYINDNKKVITNNATREQVENAARKIYKDYPEILKALGL